jgi:hypothetical protein
MQTQVALWVRKEHHPTLQRLWPLKETGALAGSNRPRPAAGVGAKGSNGVDDGPISRQDEFASGTDSGEESD